METRAHYVLIGAFMLGGIFLTLLFTLWLGSVEREYDEYEIIFQQKISGLQEGANVLFNGIRVGEVAELRLDPDNPNNSLALVQVERGTPVKQDTKVELELVGVTGLAVIQFNGGSPDLPLLKRVSDEDIPQIKADLSGIAAVLDSSGDIAINIQRLISQENTEAVSRILRDVESLTDVISDREAEVSLIIDNLAVTSTSLRRTAEGLEQTMTRVDETVTAVNDIVTNDARAAIAELEASAESLSRVLATVDQLVTDNKDAVDTFAQEGLTQATAMLTKANRLVDTTEAILLEFDRDPARFLLGEGRPVAE